MLNFSQIESVNSFFVGSSRKFEERIIVVQFFSECESDFECKEKCPIKLNDRKLEYVTFVGYAENPRVVINENNVVNFGKINVDDLESRTLTIRNLTRHGLM